MTAGINYNHAINHAGDEASTGHILELLSETDHWQYGKIPIPETPVQKSLSVELKVTKILHHTDCECWR